MLISELAVDRFRSHGARSRCRYEYKFPCSRSHGVQKGALQGMAAQGIADNRPSTYPRRPSNKQSR